MRAYAENGILILSDTNDICEMLQHILDIFDKKRYIHTDVKVPAKFMSFFDSEAVEDYFDNNVGFLSNSDTDSIIRNMARYYLPKKKDIKEFKRVLSTELLMDFMTTIERKTAKGIIPIKVEVSRKIPYLEGKRTKNKVSVSVLDFDGYHVEVLFFRDDARRYCYVIYNFYFDQTFGRDILSEAFGRRALICFRQGVKEKTHKLSSEVKNIHKIFDKAHKISAGKNASLYAPVSDIVLSSDIQKGYTNFKISLLFNPDDKKEKVTEKVTMSAIPAAIKKANLDLSNISMVDDLEEESILYSPVAASYKNGKLEINVNVRNAEVVSKVVADRIFRLSYYVIAEVRRYREI